MQIKPTLSNYVSPARVAKYKGLTTDSTWKATENRYVQTLLGTCKMTQSPMEGNWAILVKITTAFTLDPAIPLMGIYSPDIPAAGIELCMDKAIDCSSLGNSKRLEIIQLPSTGDWLNKV